MGAEIMDDSSSVSWRLCVAAAAFVAANTLSIMALDSYMQTRELPPQDTRPMSGYSGLVSGGQVIDGRPDVVRPEARGIRPVARYPGSPRGFASNSSSAFVISGHAAALPARFLFSAGEGLIAGWSGDVDFAHPYVAIDATARGAVYKGIAIASAGASSVLYAADFRNNRIDVFDARFERIHIPGDFADPTLPAGFAPFGIEVIDGRVFVAYAVQDPAKRDDVKGRGHGLINVFDTSGRLVRRLVSGGRLNSPWRMAVARPGSGPLAGTLWVGNHGDGRVHAFDLETGALVAEISAGPKDPSAGGSEAETGAPDRYRVPPDDRPDGGAPPPMPQRRARIASRPTAAAEAVS
jgi:hypothetical protein